MEHEEKPDKKRLRPGIGMGFLLGFCICLIPIAIFLFREGRTLFPASPSGLPGEELPNESQEEVNADNGKLNQNYETAFSLTMGGNYAEAIPYWDLALVDSPENGNAYYYRAYCYWRLSGNQRYLTEFEDYIYKALDDVNQAITFGVQIGYRGEVYDLRYDILDNLMGITRSRIDRNYLGQLSLDDLRASVALGTSNPRQKQWIPLAYFAIQQCEEGMEALSQLKEFYGVSAPPSASVINLEAHGYLCLGDFDKALELVDRGLAIERVNSRVWLRAMILYLKGDKGEALYELDKLIRESPQYNGYRYYLRALILYENGEREAAMLDVQSGQANTWADYGLSSYVLGLIAMDDGDQALAISYLQEAYASINWYYLALLPQIEAKLAELGAAPLPETQTLFLDLPPAPPLVATPTPEDTGLLVNGFPLPPYLVPVEYKMGTKSFFRKNEYLYPVFVFQATPPVSITQVSSLVVHLEPLDTAQSTDFELFVWDLTTGEWRMLRPGWGEVVLEEPARYVDKNGDLYLAIRIDYETEITFQNIWVALEATQTDGTPVVLTKDP